MSFLVLLGRILFSAIFIMSSFTHFSKESIEYAASHGVAMPHLLVPLSGIIAFFGGLSILLGYKARLGAWLLILFLIPVTLMMHQFWTVSDLSAMKAEQANFMKNLSMLGAALLITYFGSGPFSLDRD